jgi:N-dimethylarginine dimethylaminohydrolase
MELNQTVLMSGVESFGVLELNPQSHKENQPDTAHARAEHASIRKALEDAGITVVGVEPPRGDNCQDGVYTANWALVRGDTAVLSNLPAQRQGETPFAEKYLRGQGKKIVCLPEHIRFSGQGDALSCGNLLFCGSGYRSDPEAQQFLADSLGYEIVSLQTIPLLDRSNQPVINCVTGWPDSFFYDIDLALSILRMPTDTQKGLIAWCPEAFKPESQELLRKLDEVDKIEIDLDEAMNGFAANLVSTGETVVMSAHAPKLQAELEARNFKVMTPAVTELIKGGGFIRCTTLTLDNS